MARGLRSLLWLTCLLSTIVTTSARASLSEFDPYRECLLDVEQLTAHYQRWIPEPFFAINRKLERMSEAVPDLRVNLAFLVEKSTTRGLDALDHFRLGNGVKACRSLEAAILTTGRWYEGLMACLALLVLSLVASTLFSSLTRRPV